MFKSKLWLVAIAVIGLIIIAAAAIKVAGFWPINTFRLNSGSMEPTIHAGEFLLASRTDQDLHRGDIVTWYGEGHVYLHRLVGLPGDKVELRQYHAFVNGQPEVPRAGACRRVDNDPSAGDWGPVTVPEGQYMLLGDCRDNARDSRYVGCIPRAYILKRHLRIYFSSDPQGNVRFDRLWQVIQE